MIRLMLGGLGSGKTACMVRELARNPSKRVSFSNIETNNIKNNIVITPEMIVCKEVSHTKKTGEQNFTYALNVDFWKKAVKKYGSINVVLDEAHTLIDSRRAMSKLNKVMNDYLALLRRVVGQDSRGYGELVLITQLERRLDVIAKELATSVYYHVCHYTIVCNNCRRRWLENNETPQKSLSCHYCGSNDMMRTNFIIYQYKFINVDKFIDWKYFNKKSYYERMMVEDIEIYFPLYNTLQWSNLLSEL